jgi:hypothetical protein
MILEDGICVTEESDRKVLLDVGCMGQDAVESGMSQEDIHHVIDSVTGNGKQMCADVMEDIHHECGRSGVVQVERGDSLWVGLWFLSLGSDIDQIVYEVSVVVSCHLL